MVTAKGPGIKGPSPASARRATQLKTRIAARRAKIQAAKAHPPDPFAKEIATSTRLKFAPQEQLLHQQLAASGVQQQRITDWYGNYVNQIQGAHDQQQRDTTQALGSINAEHAGAQANAGQVSSTIGQSSSTGQSLADQAAASRKSMADAFAAKTASNGAIEGNLYNERGVSASAGALNAHQAEATKAANIQTALKALAGQKGDYATQLRSQLQAADAKLQLESAALGLKQDQFKTQTQQNAQKLNLDKQALRSLDNNRKSTAKEARHRDNQNAANNNTKNALQQGRLALDAAKAANAAGKGSGGGKNTGPTRSQKIRAHTQFEKGATLIQGISGPKATRASLEQYLAGKGIDPLLARAAVATKFYGGVDAQTQHQIKHRYGITLKRAGNPISFVQNIGHALGIG